MSRVIINHGKAMPTQNRKGQTRNRMIFGAIDLLRRRGLNATSVREVVKHSETPRGSVQHHFPNGKQQLIEAAMTTAKDLVSKSLTNVVAKQGSAAGVLQFIDEWMDILSQNDFEVGCPILAVSVEQYISEDGAPNIATQGRFLGLANKAFVEWQDIFSSAMVNEGCDPERARRLSRLIISSVEGALVMCRAAKSLEPLKDVREELSLLIN
jgi:AcrR family transcriptional regulator